jgi:hypothetical protein
MKNKFFCPLFHPFLITGADVSEDEQISGKWMRESLSLDTPSKTILTFFRSEHTASVPPGKLPISAK